MSKRLFAIGDNHGCFDSLKELVENKIQLQKNDMVFVGGAVAELYASDPAASH